VDVYAGYVFDFKSIKDEMNAIEGKGSPAGGRVSLSRFMDGLIAYYNNVK
jgi:two-component system response regulator YcbB